MHRPSNGSWKSSGLPRLRKAARHQLDGMKHGLLHDSAIRQVSIAVFLLCLLAFCMPVTRLETLLLILPLLLVALVEYLNSAIEAVVDRVSLDHHPLSRIAKDYASVAVAIAVGMAVLSWAVILGPLCLRLLGIWQ